MDFSSKCQTQAVDMGMGTPKCHVVAVPYPGRGHVNPMINICKQLLLLSSSNTAGNIKITFVVTEEWLGFIESAPPPKPSNIEFRSIPNVIPSELVRALNFVDFLEAVYTKMEAPFEELLDQLDLPVTTAIMADTALSWAVAVGNRRNIPVVSLWTMSPSVFSVFYHADLVTQNRHLPINLSECGGELIENIPGISPTRLEDLPTIFFGNGIRTLGRVLEAFDWVRKAQSLLLTSFHELESHVTDTLKEILPFPVYSVGPSIPYTEIMETESEFDLPSNYYVKWLDSQPSKSVLYVSLGSFLLVSREQMDEIMFGLIESGVRFLWVAREDTCRIQEVCGDMGFVVPWCDQLRVLCHSSVGGFWTHCGWNSTLEGVFAGVPMLTFPIAMDQIPNRKLIVDDLKVGLKFIKKAADQEGMVKRDEIGMIVKRFMDLDEDESKEMRRRASELKETCRRALAKNGSSETNLNAFARDILKCHG